MQKVINFDYIRKENIKKHNLNWLNITDHPYRMLIIGGSGGSLFNLLSHQPDIDKIYLYTKDPQNQSINCYLTNEKVEA